MHYSDRLKGGIDSVGISNFSTFLKNTAGYRRNLRRAEYGDERDPEIYKFHQKIAPLNHANKITKPLFVIQGLNDPRVPVSEAEQIVKAVHDNGVEVWYLLAKNEGHGFKKRKNSKFLTRAKIAFIKKYLLN
jgi:dipeptidyl aminopeptidase/acylaminoacyl peptidase